MSSNRAGMYKVWPSGCYWTHTPISPCQQNQGKECWKLPSIDFWRATLCPPLKQRRPSERRLWPDSLAYWKWGPSPLQSHKGVPNYVLSLQQDIVCLSLFTFCKAGSTTARINPWAHSAFLCFISLTACGRWLVGCGRLKWWSTLLMCHKCCLGAVGLHLMASCSQPALWVYDSHLAHISQGLMVPFQVNCI